MKNIKCRNCFFYRNEWCEKIVDSPDPEEARDCNYFREMTNADRIRSISDEELADFLNQWGTSTRAWQKDPGETLYWLQKTAGEEDKHENYT